MFVQPKTAKGRRRVRLTPIAVEALKRHEGIQNGEKSLLDGNGRWQENGLVFPSQVGTPMDPDNLVNRSFKRFLKNAGLPPIRFQNLRHTFAKLMSKGENARRLCRRCSDTPTFPSPWTPTPTFCRACRMGQWADSERCSRSGNCQVTVKRAGNHPDPLF